MTNERIPDDPYRTGLSDDNFSRQQRLDRDLQVDPELQEGPASSGKIALFAVGIAVVLGAVFYGLNNTSVKEAQTSPPAQTAQQQQSQPPKANTEPGMTTGAAPNRASPPQSAPKGAEIDRSAGPTTNSNDNK
jgi:hypothetical protein